MGALSTARGFGRQRPPQPRKLTPCTVRNHPWEAPDPDNGGEGWRCRWVVH
jgi:hypothetical protein